MCLADEIERRPVAGLLQFSLLSGKVSEKGGDTSGGPDALLPRAIEEEAEEQTSVGLFLLVACSLSLTARQFSVCLWSSFIIMIINLPLAGFANI